MDVITEDVIKYLKQTKLRDKPQIYIRLETQDILFKSLCEKILKDEPFEEIDCVLYNMHLNNIALRKSMKKDMESEKK